MNYLKIYNMLITRAQTASPAGYVEKHHIMPRCLNGSDDPSNLIKLTPEEHFLAHQLLVKIYPDNKSLIYALSAMCMSADSKNMIRNNKMFGWIKRKISESRAGIPRSEETKDKIRQARKLQIVLPETGIKISKKAKGRKLSEEHKANISKGQTGKIVSDEAKENIRKSLAGRNKGLTYEEIYGAEKADELRKIRSSSLSGKPKSAEHRQKLADANKGNVPSDITRDKISKANKGRVTSEETKLKISNSLKAKQAAKHLMLLTCGLKIPLKNSE